jgi:hypothetical protein
MASDATVLVAPYFTDGAGAAPMIWAALAGDKVRMPESYAYVPSEEGTPIYGSRPTQVSRIMERIQHTGVVVVARGGVREQVARDLADRGVTDVIVGPMEHQGAMVSFFRDLLGRDPDEVEGVFLWRDVDAQGVAPAPD